MTPSRFGIERAIAGAVLIAIVLSGCGSRHDSATTTTVAGELKVLPCGDGVTKVELGSPYLGSQAGPADFTTTGGPLYIAARRFEHGGIFDPATGRTAIYIGKAATPPTWDPRSNVVSNTTAQVDVQERRFARLNIAPGRYWLLSSNGGDVVVTSCNANGVSQ